MKRPLSAAWFLTSAWVAAACTALPQSPAARTPVPASATGAASPALRPGEDHLADVRQLTFGGENAEAYWSFDGRELVLQSKHGGASCDRIYRLPLAAPELVPVSSGRGATTCAYFFPNGEEVLYASTHLGGDACPPPPDRSQGYVWALYPSYDIFKVRKQGGEPVRLTSEPGYDAEATVCGKDGSIVFTSVRDGDIELYRMDADGKNVRRLTNTPGYDGGAFFNADCSKILWRASRPRPGKELDDYRALLGKALVRPSKLELYVANADGSDPVQITYLDAASFAPYWHPSGRRVLFSSNYGDPKGREFDIFAVDVTGAGLERITTAPGFDGFPMFSPDGQELAFASNRATAEGSRDTNVFVARWQESPAKVIESAADRVFADVVQLADPKLEGRGVGTAGLEAAGAYIEQRFKSLGLAPAGDGASYRQSFAVPTALEAGAGTRVAFDGRALGRDDFVPLGFSPAKSAVQADVVLSGYGIVAKELGVDDYARLDVKGKIVLVRRYVPEDAKFASTEHKRRFGDLRYKAWLAKERGALALLVVDAPMAPPGAPKDWKAPEEPKLPALAPEGYGDAGIPVVIVKRATGQPLIDKLTAHRRVRGEIAVELSALQKPAFNVIGRIRASRVDREKGSGVIVIGAHYDHLGLGGRHSLAPDKREPHVGADDNASGTAVLLEIARALAADSARLTRDVVIAAFSAEESGLLGSAHFVRLLEKGQPRAIDPKQIVGMINLDMVGRMRENRVQVLGSETAAEWRELLAPACEQAGVGCALAADGGYGPSDQMSFYLAGVPVLHFFTGGHADYHKPSDVPSKINAAGAAQIGKIITSVASSLSTLPRGLTFKSEARGPAPRGDMRSFNASLGTIPDYAGPGPGKSGVLLGGVRPGGAAERAGLRRGDLVTKIGRHSIHSIEDLMYVLNASQPGETTSVTVIRDGKPLNVDVTFQEQQRSR